MKTFLVILILAIFSSITIGLCYELGKAYQYYYEEHQSLIETLKKLAYYKGLFERTRETKRSMERFINDLTKYKLVQNGR